MSAVQQPTALAQYRETRKAISRRRYLRRYARHPAPAAKKRALPPVVRVEPGGKRYSLKFLRDLCSSVERVVRGYEHVLAKRSAEFRLRPSRSKYQPHQGERECARRKRM